MKYIKSFQRNNGLIADGIIGKRTIKKMMQVFDIRSNKSIAHFLGQVAEESANYSKSRENLNYSARGLRKIFGRYFSYSESIKYARKKEQIANIVYDDRGPRTNKLGNIYDGDGWKYIGRGGIQVTGRSLYEELSIYFKVDFINHPELLEKPEWFWKTALFIFDTRKIWKHTYSISDTNIRKITRIINGGYNGLEHRKTLTKHYYQLSKNIRV